MTTHLEAQFPELTPFLDGPVQPDFKLRAIAVLHREQIRATLHGGPRDGELIGAFYTGDGHGVERLRSWLKSHPEVVLTNVVGFRLHAKEG